jgi:endoglucanase
MKTLFYTKVLIFLVVFAGVFKNYNTDAQLLAVSGQKIINTSNDQEVVLNAINFGNWMVMEGYMMNSSDQAPSQHIWKQKLTALLGSNNTKAFYDAWLANHVTQADIDQVKAWGFNSVRLPLHYEYFVNLGTPDVWNDQGFTILDSVLLWCRTAGIYAIIDLHAAPGGQSDNVISDYDNTKPALWGNGANKTKTVKLWRKLSERYKNDEWIAGYDLINEPAWDLPGGTELRNIYNRLTDTIRGNSDKHILFIEGNWYSNDYSGLTPAWDANMVYVFHKYWSNTSDGDLKWVLDLRTAQNRPIWCGEHGENSNTHFTKHTELMQRNNIGMSWWPMKKFESINDFADAKYPSGYTDVLNYLGGTNPGLSSATAFSTLMQLAENLKLKNCKVNDEVLRTIFVQPGNRLTEPFTTNNIPGTIYAVNYDKGMNGYAYSDQAWEDVRSTIGNYTAWNEGWTYRNNGVDIEACIDALSNGYNVGWFNAGEWMQYTCEIASAGSYSIECRVANGNGTNGTLQIQNENGTEILASASIPPTGGWKNYTTVTCSGGFSLTGTQKIRIANTSGGFNMASVKFIYLNGNIPATTPVSPAAKILSLKGNNSKYITFSGPDFLLSCTSNAMNATEQFEVVDAGNDLAALKGSNGLYVSLSNSNSKLYCNSASIGNSEKFVLENLCGYYSIKGFNNMYVSAQNGSIAGITCSKSTPGSSEFFNWTTISNPYKFIAVTSVSFSVALDSIEVGGSQQLTATVLPTNASIKTIRYNTGNTDIATINQTGQLKGISTGTTYIYAASQEGSYTDSCLVIVVLELDILQSSAKSGFKLFPNPAQNSVTVTSLKNHPASIEIYDVTGKKVLRTSFKDSKLKLDISGIPNGVYFTKCIDSNKTETIKFIKNK